MKMRTSKKEYFFSCLEAAGKISHIQVEENLGKVYKVEVVWKTLNVSMLMRFDISVKIIKFTVFPY